MGVFRHAPASGHHPHGSSWDLGSILIMLLLVLFVGYLLWAVRSDVSTTVRDMSSGHGAVLLPTGI